MLTNEFSDCLYEWKSEFKKSEQKFIDSYENENVEIFPKKRAR